MPVNDRSYRNQMNQAERALRGLEEAALKQFIKNTPVRSGNARRNTKLRGSKIVADYPYSERLDQGYSNQSPRGMVEPTEQWIQREVERRLKGI